MDIGHGSAVFDAGVSEMYLDYLQNPTYADLTITCQHHTWHVHKVIVAARSGILRLLIAAAPDSTIDLPNDQPETLARLLLHIYSGTYHGNLLEELKLQTSTFVRQLTGSADETRTTHTFTKLNLAVDLFAIGLAHDVPSMRTQAAEAARRAFLDHWQQRDIEISDKFTAFVRKVYATTPATFPKMRDTVVRMVLVRVQFPLTSEFLNLLADTPAFATDLVSCTTAYWRCQSCDAHSRVLLRPCECGRTQQICGQEECEHTYRKRTICWNRICGEQGAMEPNEPRETEAHRRPAERRRRGSTRRSSQSAGGQRVTF